MKRLAALLLLCLTQPALADIPYRYSILEGFIVTLDDEPRNSLANGSADGHAVIDTIAWVLERDQVRIPVEYGRTVAWDLGKPILAGTNREAQLDLFRENLARDASRSHPANVLFVSVIERRTGVRVLIDWVGVTRGERRQRYRSDPIICPDPCNWDVALAPYFEEVAKSLLLELGRAPPRGYGDVPPPWLLMEPRDYRIDLRGFDEEMALDVIDILTLDIPHYLESKVEQRPDGRVLMTYQTNAPSWWIAEELAKVLDEIGVAADIEPRRLGLRVIAAE